MIMTYTKLIIVALNSQSHKSVKEMLEEQTQFNNSRQNLNLN